jgi:adenine-specific DNA-methyltransferase
LSNGKLAKALDGIAPKVKGGYVRCYKRFLLKMRLSRA